MTTGDPSPCYLYPQHHQICHPDEQTTHPYSNEHRRKDTSGCHTSHSLYSSLNYQQIVLHICSILANLRDSLYYMREVTIHTMDYVDAARTGILLPHVIPAKDLREMLSHIEETCPSTMHLPTSSEDALHF